MRSLQKKNLLVLAVSIIGLVISFVSLWHRQGVLNGGLDAPSFCSVGQKFDCDTVALSPYAEFLGIPTASWAIAFYVVMLIASIFVFLRASQFGAFERSLTKGMLAMALFGIIPTAYLFWISYSALQTLCLLCIGNYVCNVALLFLTVGLSRDVSNLRTSPTDLSTTDTRGRMAPLAATFAVGIGLSLASGWILDRGSPVFNMSPELLSATALQDYASSPFKRINIGASASRGPETAPITVVEFSDFQCPVCARASATLPRVFKGYSDQVRVVFKHYPLDATCNSRIQGGRHPLACHAADLGVCVTKLKGGEGFFEYKTNAFKEQARLTRERLRALAIEVVTNEKDLDACLADPATRTQVMADIEEGHALGVDGTPTVFVNGRRFQMALIPRAMNALIEGLLQTR